MSMSSAQDSRFFVKTVSELDQLVYEHLLNAGAAQKRAPGETGYRILDRERARSTLVMPQVLNPLGQEGWRLVAVNKMESYIFERGQPVEYLVQTPADIDKRSIRMLQKSGAMEVTGFEGEAPRMEITRPKEARIQIVLPQVLAELASEGWTLAAINGPQLYFFIRPLEHQKQGA